MIPVFVFRAIKLPLVCLLAVEAAAVTMLPVYWSQMRRTETILSESGDRLEEALNQEIHRATEKALRLLAPEDAAIDVIEPSTLAERQASEADAGVLSDDEVHRRLEQTSQSDALVEYPPGTDALIDSLESFKGSISIGTPWNPPIAQFAVKMANWEQKSRSPRGDDTTANGSSSLTQTVSRPNDAEVADSPTTIELLNSAENGLTVHFLWGNDVQSLEPGESRRWPDATAWVKFDTGLPDAPPAKLQVAPGSYRFELSKESGWQLQRVQ